MATSNLLSENDFKHKSILSQPEVREESWEGERELSVSCNVSIKLSTSCQLGPKLLMVSGLGKGGFV